MLPIASTLPNLPVVRLKLLKAPIEPMDLDCFFSLLEGALVSRNGSPRARDTVEGEASGEPGDNPENDGRL